MNTPTFQRFLAQLHAVGREKMDGFDRSHFDGLTPSERSEARALLSAALLKRDTTAAHGLVLLDGSESVPELERILQAYPRPSYERAVIAGELSRLTRNPMYADMLATVVEAFADPDEHMRRTALVYLEDTPPTPAVVAALRRAVRGEPSQTARFLAVAELFYSAGIVSSVAQVPRPYPELIAAIVHGTQEERGRAADEIDALLSR